MKFLPILLSLLALTALHGQEEAPVAEDGETRKPPVEKLDENRYRIGDVTIDKRTREIRFPALVNLREGILEYLIVHQNGKIHESLFRTETSPTNINLAFTLLSYKPSKELYRSWREPRRDFG